MVYIYKKTRGNGNYFYLRASKRKDGKKIEKDIAYLGRTVEEARENFPRIVWDKQEIKAVADVEAKSQANQEAIDRQAELNAA